MRVMAYATAALVLLAAPALGHGYKVLYSFCSQSSCTDGQTPNSLVADAHGNLFGTTYLGGSGLGTIFELTRKGTHYSYEQLYSFCQQTNCTDGGFPTGGLIVDTEGNLYGAALIGGSQGNGEVFELVRGSNSWTISVLYGFCPQGHDCTDGVGPDSGLAYTGQSSGQAYDGTSPLFGTTDGGGTAFDGIAYEIQPQSGKWSQSVIYDFCSVTGCTDGAGAYGNLVEDPSGNLYGTTVSGGAQGDGTAFELSSANGSWSETVLYSFCTLKKCTDGSSPLAGVLLDSSGNLDGVTPQGGAACHGVSNGCGVAYTITPNGQSSKETVQYSFCKQTNCADGAAPEGVPAVDGKGHLFGVTNEGGNVTNNSNGGGTLYELRGSKLKTLHTFCAKVNCTDGSGPNAGPVSGAKGRLFGTTASGGTGTGASGGGGIVYEFDK